MKIKKNIVAHFQNHENCYDAPRSWIQIQENHDGTNFGYEIVMIEYRGLLESLICWREISTNFGIWEFGTIEKFMGGTRD